MGKHPHKAMQGLQCDICTIVAHAQQNAPPSERKNNKKFCKNLEYYKNLVNSGYKYIAFDLKVGGADAANLQNMVIFCGQQISTLTKVGDVYKVKMQLDKLLEFYTTINSIATASGRSGTTGSKSALFLAWRDNRGSDIGQVRNYTFTISNSAYVAE